MLENLLNGSDKQYWHRFLPVYEEELAKLTNCESILEFGVFKGDSIKWLNQKYPNAEIFGSDILAIQPSWPTEKNINYLHVDQGDVKTIKEVFKTIGKKLDLIIEDGSHMPVHQKNCLIESLQHMNSGGVYILEDLHTSHPEHKLYKKTGSNFISPLHLLLLIEHLQAAGLTLDQETLNQFKSKSLFTPEEAQSIFEKISKIKLFRRATLPHKCYSCGSSAYQYHNLKCKCGVDIYSNSDSITALLFIK